MLHGDQSAARIGAGRAGLSTFLPPMIAVKSMQQEIFRYRSARVAVDVARASDRPTDHAQARDGPCGGQGIRPRLRHGSFL